MKWRAIIFLFAFSLFSCERQATQPAGYHILKGVWTETFAWYDPHYHVHLETGAARDTNLIRTSTLIFTERVFSLKILPPHRVLAVRAGEVVVTDSPDTAYAGTYQITQNILSLWFKDHLEQYLFTIAGDRLQLMRADKQDLSGVTIYSPVSVLWANSWMKDKGVFVKR